MLLKNKTAIITGCNRGIGKCILETFVKNGANIIACIRKENLSFSLFVEDLQKKYNVKIVPFYFDFENSDEIKVAISKIHRLKIPIDILVNNCGIASGSFFQMTQINEIERIMKINFTSQIQFTQGISRIMIRQKSGSIINITSVSGIDGETGNLSYGSSKAALNYATKTIAAELGIYNIRVNAIAPSITKTDMFNQMNQFARDKLTQNSCLKRVAEIEEIANAVLFLASNLSCYITNQIIRVDGGII